MSSPRAGPPRAAVWTGTEAPCPGKAPGRRAAGRGKEREGPGRPSPLPLDEGLPAAQTMPQPLLPVHGGQGRTGFMRMKTRRHGLTGAFCASRLRTHKFRALVKGLLLGPAKLFNKMTWGQGETRWPNWVSTPTRLRPASTEHAW